MGGNVVLLPRCNDAAYEVPHTQQEGCSTAVFKSIISQKNIK